MCCLIQTCSAEKALQDAVTCQRHFLSLNSSKEAKGNLLNAAEESESCWYNHHHEGLLQATDQETLLTLDESRKK